MVRKNSKRPASKNRNASIRSRVDRNGKLRTETFRRDEGSIQVSVSTNERTNTTRLYVNSPDGSVYRFSGRDARTIYRTLQKHFQNTGKQS